MTAVNTTSTTHGAREHARAQAAQARAATQQTIPASAATDLPPGVAPGEVVWDETIPAGGYATRELSRGSMLRMTDLEGDACLHCLVFNARQPIERFNLADTVKVLWQAYPTTGGLLLSDMGRVLMSIREDTCGHHDTFCGASTPWSNAAKYGQSTGINHKRNARDNFLVALAKHGLEARDIPGSITFFKGVRIDAEGAINYITNSSKPGDLLELKAEMDVLIVLANCPHVLDPRTEYACTPARVTAWRGTPTPYDDPFRTLSPEIERAFLNNDDYHLR